MPLELLYDRCHPAGQEYNQLEVQALGDWLFPQASQVGIIWCDSGELLVRFLREVLANLMRHATAPFLDYQRIHEAFTHLVLLLESREQI